MVFHLLRLMLLPTPLSLFQQNSSTTDSECESAKAIDKKRAGCGADPTYTRGSLSYFALDSSAKKRALLRVSSWLWSRIRYNAASQL